jgi:hypothetical protein
MPNSRARAIPSRWRSRINARSNSAKAPITESNKLAIGESSPVKCNPSLTNSIRMPRLKAEVQKAARLEMNKKKHQSKLVYYRLLQGVKNLFAGVKKVYLFRWKRRTRKVLPKTYSPILYEIVCTHF